MGIPALADVPKHAEALVALVARERVGVGATRPAGVESKNGISQSPVRDPRIHDGSLAPANAIRSGRPAGCQRGR